ncbi:hypothetical protein PV08_03898 [Exophiala spinifera]|uniref:HAD hydrolase, family IA n=1 Tax=Exophiala spinifera TaxID=91928 RepID=A0A0D2BZG0_9EURO|nr:uncharacterized protein PV08_03898 [Exophiala spinifera]KIW16709.1 hypothetical protein PV08_03898 [Exophiala spinifera]
MSEPPRNPYKFIFFDCDNTITLSEYLAMETVSGLVNDILERNGKPERYTKETLIAKFVGYSFRKMLPEICQEHGIQLSTELLQYYASVEEERVIATFGARGQSCAGALKIIENLYEGGEYKLAIVSSSTLSRVQAQIEITGAAKYFEEDCVFSAQNSMSSPSSKPDPAIYIHAMEKLGAKPHECLAIEDSITGCRAAIRANIATIGYVGSYETGGHREFMKNTLKRAGCCVIMREWEDWDRVFQRMLEMECA